MKRLLLVMFAFCSVAHAQYDVSSLLAVTKKDKAVFVRSLSQVGIRGSETRVLRAYLLSEVICKVQSASAEAFCRDLRRHEDLDGQEALDLSRFSVNTENLEVTLNAVRGALLGASYSLSPENVQTAQRLIQGLNAILASKQSLLASVDAVSKAFDQSTDLIAEMMQTQSLQAYGSLISQVPLWLKAKAVVAPVSLLAWKFSVRSGDSQCVINFKDEMKCWESAFPFRDLASPLKNQRKVKALTKAANDSNCAFLEEQMSSPENVACWGTSYLERSVAKGEKACLGNMVDPKSLLIRDPKLASQTKYAATVNCGRREWSALFDAKSQLLDVIRTVPAVEGEKALIRWIPSGAHHLSLYQGVLFFLTADGDLRWDAREAVKELNINALPKKDVEQLKTDGSTSLCVLKKKGGWTCLSKDVHALFQDGPQKKDSYTGKLLPREKSWQLISREFTFEFPRGELVFGGGVHVITDSNIYYGTIHPEGKSGNIKAQVRSFPKPSGATNFTFSDNFYDEQYDWDSLIGKDDQLCPLKGEYHSCYTSGGTRTQIWKPESQYFCYLVAGGVPECRDRLSQKQRKFYEGSYRESTEGFEGFFLWETTSVSYDRGQPPQICAYSKERIYCPWTGLMTELIVWDSSFDRKENKVKISEVLDLSSNLYSTDSSICHRAQRGIRCFSLFAYGRSYFFKDDLSSVDLGPLIGLMNRKSPTLEYRFGIATKDRYKNEYATAVELDRRL